MSLLMDAPPVVGVLEGLEARRFDSMSVGEAGEVVREVALVHGRADVVHAKALAVFARGNGAQADGATDTTSWLANVTKTSGRDAKRSVKRAKVLDALPVLSDALAAANCSVVAQGWRVGGGGEVVDTRRVGAQGASVGDRQRRRRRRWSRGAAQSTAAGEVPRFGVGDAGMFGEWDPEATAPIERAVDLVADELWRVEHPTRDPTVLDEKTLKFRRAEAVSEIARRILARAEAEAAVTSADTDADTDETAAASAPCEPDTSVADDAAVAAEPTGAAAADDGQVAPAKAPITSKRATPKTPKSRPAVVALSVLFALIDHQTLLGQLAVKGICELFDGTPISPDTVRRLACDAGIIPMVLGSRGEVLNQGRRIYLPTVAQRHAVAVRDRHCAFPGCRRPAKWTDVHQIVAFKPGAATGGKTDLDNLLLLCDKHHHMVHEQQWRLTGTALDFDVFRPDGSLFDHVTRGPP